MHTLIVGEHMEPAMLAMPLALDIEQRMALYFGDRVSTNFCFFQRSPKLTVE
jgi:hypothetical protein